MAEAARTHARAFAFAVAMLLASCNQARKEPQASFIEPANDLEAALVRSASVEGNNNKLVESLLNSTVYVRTHRKLIASEGKLRDNTQLTYLTVEVNGSMAMAIYTSVERLSEVHGPGAYVGLNGREALRLADGLPVSLNYGLVPSALLKREQVARILSRKPARAASI